MKRIEARTVVARVPCHQDNCFALTWGTLTFSCLAAILFILMIALPAPAQALRSADIAVTDSFPADKALSKTIPSGFMTLNIDNGRKVRSGDAGKISISDKKAAVLINADGEEVRQTSASSLQRYGVYSLYGTLFTLGLFFLHHGRTRLAGGFTGQTIERFSNVERTAHWLMAMSFIVLGVTGLNSLYGKEILLPWMGSELFAWLTETAKWLHNYVSFAFMAGLALSFFFWVRDNIPRREDLQWLAKVGGMFSKGDHIPARKFNARQKILFWLIMLSGMSISLSGLAVWMPFQFPIFGPIFGLLNTFGSDLPTNLSPLQEMQYATLLHGIVGLFMMCLIMVHIYIRSVGVEGAFDAMRSGQVDVNWARTHHSLWAEEVLGPDPNVASRDTDGTPQAQGKNSGRGTAESLN